VRLWLEDAHATLHLFRVHPRRVATRVAVMPEPQRLLAYCRSRGITHAVVGGFFVRPQGTPLGELRIAGRSIASRPFDEPWARTRACVHLNGAVSLARRPQIGPAPAGDLLQAGPLLVEDGINLVRTQADPEGFSSGAHQFDSDITVGRYPRAALALTEADVIAVACDGRSAEDPGMTLSELADALIGLGAHTAINLDGGGSASLVAEGRLINRPREEHGLDIVGGRAISTALVFEPR
jgi:Phosphodiester glycosidase